MKQKQTDNEVLRAFIESINPWDSNGHSKKYQNLATYFGAFFVEFTFLLTVARCVYTLKKIL